MICALKEALSHRSDNFFRKLTVIGTTSGGMSFGEEYYRSLKPTSRFAACTDSGRKLSSAKADPRCTLRVAKLSRPVRLLPTRAPPAPTQLVTPSIAFSPVNIAGSHRGLRRHLRTGLCRFRFASSIDAGQMPARSIEIAAAWCWAKAQRFWLWKILIHAQSRGAKILAEIIGYGISTDNHHLTQPDPSGIGPRQAMEQALRSANIAAPSWITLMPTALPPLSMMPPKGKRSLNFSRPSASQFHQIDDGPFVRGRGRDRSDFLSAGFKHQLCRQTLISTPETTPGSTSYPGAASRRSISPFQIPLGLAERTHPS